MQGKQGLRVSKRRPTRITGEGLGLKKGDGEEAFSLNPLSQKGEKLKELPYLGVRPGESSNQRFLDPHLVGKRPS